LLLLPHTTHPAATALLRLQLLLLSSIICGGGYIQCITPVGIELPCPRSNAGVKKLLLLLLLLLCFFCN
jgi:hypothetical protein